MPAKKQITKEMILASALKLLKENGFEAVNIKALANDLHCSTQPVYLSFKNMDELRKELGQVAIQEFTSKCHSLYDMDYIRFAKTEPHLFCFLFMRKNAFEEMKKILKPMIETSIQEILKKYPIDYEKADLLHDHLWLHAHGIASMIACEFCTWDLDKVNQMLEESKKVFLDAYCD